MHYLKGMNCDIILIQDTHLSKEKVASFNCLWRGKSYHSSYSNNSRGTSILVSKNLQHDVINEHINDNGNYVMLECKIGTDLYMIGCVYGPNRDEPQFYEQLGDVLDSTDCDHVILGGDFNFVMDAKNDCYGYARENNVNARKKFTTVCNKHDLVDIWRHHNPDQHQFTWFTPTPSKGARLDMFFVSNHLSSLCSDLQIIPGYRTDHNMITMCLEVGELQRGPGLWKFNESLLNDEEYAEVVNQCVNRTVMEYAVPVYAHDFLLDPSNYKYIQFKINEDLFYETLLMLIRGETVRYSKSKAKRIKAEEKILISQIDEAYVAFSHVKSDENAQRLQTCKNKLEDIRKPRINGLIVRSRTRWHEKGEKSSKYFLGLEKSNAMRKTVTFLKDGRQNVTRTDSILQKFTENLSEKYNKRYTLPPLAENIISDNVYAKLSIDERSRLEQPLSFEEITEALRKMKKGKSPGSNGYTACFFKYFWNLLGPFLYRAFLYCSRQGRMLLSHREGVVTMIPKAGKPSNSVKGWRPITLLNIDFKVISTAISARLQCVMEKLIDPCQTAYIKGRYIGENTRLVFDIINRLVTSNESGLIMSADFEAAFDSVSWDFVSKALKHYNFGPYFRKLIDTLYLNVDNFSRIMLNGYLGEKIHLHCGVRQGDPASGNLFNLAVNILAQQIKHSQLITGIKLAENNEVRLSQYADDTVLFLKNSSDCLNGALQELKTFSEVSGLRLNIDKTSCLQIGRPNQQLCQNNHSVKFVTHMKILGISFTNNNDSITKRNIEPKLVQIEKEIAQWRRRNITPMGRITVIKSLLLSKLVHLFSALPNPSETELKQLERLFFHFLWPGKRDLIKRAKVVQDYAHGGLRMVDLQAFVKCMKVSWLKRFMTTNAAWGLVVAKEIPDIQDLLCYGSKKLFRLCRNINNPFWRDVLEAFASFSSSSNPSMPEILSESLWFSDYSKFKYSVVNKWNKKGIRFLVDLVDENNGTLHTQETLEERFKIKMTFLCFASLIRSLPDCMKEITIVKELGPVMPLRMNLVMNHPDFTRLVYDTFLESERNGLARVHARLKEKWMRDIGYFDESCFLKVMNITSSTRNRMFHYKLSNRVLATNRYLRIIKVKEDDGCTFCKLEPETLVHVYWHCPRVQAFIASIKTDIFRNYCYNVDINAGSWFFLTTLKAAEACIILLAKMVIYEARLRETCPNITHLKNKLKQEIEVEYNAARLANKQTMFEKKWGSLKDIYRQAN